MSSFIFGSADLPVDGRQMEIFPLVAIEDLFRDLEHADGMHPFGKFLMIAG
jgi:hypothetical protein